MTWWTDFDVPYAIRQLMAVTCLAFAPLLLWGAIRSRRILVAGILPIVCATTFWLLFVTLSISARIWSTSHMPHRPLRVGPSSLSLIDFVQTFAWLLWLPSLVGAAVLYLRRRRGRTALSRRAAFSVIGVYTAVAVLCSTVVLGAWYSHEDTVYAEGFTLAKWGRLHAGMTRADVHAVLGEPLAGHCRFAPAVECWVANYSAGHFAAVWFESDRVVRVHRWFSD